VTHGTVILHSRADDVIPFGESEELAKKSGAALIEVGSDHRLADLEPLEAMLRALRGNESVFSTLPCFRDVILMSDIA
jgi:hypothetical protein